MGKGDRALQKSGELGWSRSTSQRAVGWKWLGHSWMSQEEASIKPSPRHTAREPTPWLLLCEGRYCLHLTAQAAQAEGSQGAARAVCVAEGQTGMQARIF